MCVLEARNNLMLNPETISARKESIKSLEGDSEAVFTALLDRDLLGFEC